LWSLNQWVRGSSHGSLDHLFHYKRLRAAIDLLPVFVSPVDLPVVRLWFQATASSRAKALTEPGRQQTNKIRSTFFTSSATVRPKPY
jgi:hypothetical protein